MACALLKSTPSLSASMHKLFAIPQLRGSLANRTISGAMLRISRCNLPAVLRN